MVKKTKIAITTKTGDTGISGLANGQRLSKASLYFEVVGTVDELNSWLGLVVVHLEKNTALMTVPLIKQHIQFLKEVQNTLFYLGAEVAQSPKAGFRADFLDKLESATQTMHEALADDWHTRFVLPGGTEIGAWLDICRTVCRRAERHAVQLYAFTSEQSALEQDSNNQDSNNQDSTTTQTPLNPEVIKYLNRLSDYLYLLRCLVNDSSGYQETEFVA